MGFKSSGRATHRTATAVVLAAGLLAALLATLAGCGSGRSSQPGVSPTGTPTTPSPAVSPSTRPTPSPVGDLNGATPAPSWLGQRVLPIGPDGFGIAKGTPPELRDRRIITKDLLPPPANDTFDSRIATVPATVVKRSTWSRACPVSLDQLRYVTVSFRGFDGLAHTGELLVNRSVASDVVTVFRRLFAADWPIEEMRITSQPDLSAPPTGDGNDTSAFACRPVRGQTAWSQHAYGLAIDVDPFDNPYVDGTTVLPELAKFYTNRRRGLAGMITPGSVPVAAFRSIGWGWGGSYTTKKDWMHFSSTGG